MTRGAYSQYVSANAAKSGKSVSPKVRQKGDLPTRSRFGRHGTAGLSAVALAKAGGFFQHSPNAFYEDPSWDPYPLDAFHEDPFCVPYHREWDIVRSWRSLDNLLPPVSGSSRSTCRFSNNPPFSDTYRPCPFGAQTTSCSLRRFFLRSFLLGPATCLPRNSTKKDLA